MSDSLKSGLILLTSIGLGAVVLFLLLRFAIPWDAVMGTVLYVFIYETISVVCVVTCRWFLKKKFLTNEKRSISLTILFVIIAIVFLFVFSTQMTTLLLSLVSIF